MVSISASFHPQSDGCVVIGQADTARSTLRHNATPKYEHASEPHASTWSREDLSGGSPCSTADASSAAKRVVGELTHQVRLLLGHSLIGISQSYITRAIVQGRPGLGAAQRAIWRRIISLLGAA